MYMTSVLCFFFFFQAEDGIRDYKVTGVQTCALPISSSARNVFRGRVTRLTHQRPGTVHVTADVGVELVAVVTEEAARDLEIGRASCRGRVEISVVAGSLKKKKRKER